LIPKELETIEEIRLRAGKPLMLESCSGSWFVNQRGRLEKKLYKRKSGFQLNNYKSI
jgi:stage III sporulation protein AA